MELLQYTFMQRAFLSGILLAVITPLYWNHDCSETNVHDW